MQHTDAPSGYDPATLEYYITAAPTYSGSGSGGRNRFLDEFLERLPPGAHVLELGCGGGIDAAVMLHLGFAVDATEGSPAIAAIASGHLGKKVAVLRFDELEAVGIYDAVWASASLIHVPRGALTDVLKRIYRALKPGGLHFATYKSGGKEGRDSMGHYYNYPSASELRSFYSAAAAWKSISVREYTGCGFENGSGPWVANELRKALS